MAVTGLPIPDDRDVLPRPSNVVGAGAYSVAQSWLNIAQANKEAADAEGQAGRAAAQEGAANYASGQAIAAAGAQVGEHAIALAREEARAARTAQIANFEVDWRAKKTQARDDFTLDPDGFKKWADESMDGAISNVPSWMVPHAKQFLSREFEGAQSAILGERRAQDKRMDAESMSSRLKMADDDLMAIVSNTGSLNSPEAKAALVTHQAVLDSTVTTGLMSKDKAQLITEDLTTRAESAIIRKSVEQVYREKGFGAAREHLDQELTTFGAPYRVTDKVRQSTLAWLRSEESGMRGERDAVSRDWSAMKPMLQTMDPTRVAELQDRAYSIGAFKVGDDIQAHSSALSIVRNFRQLPQADQVRILASGNIDARLAQNESGGDPTKINQLGYVGKYQFGAPRVADLGVYAPGSDENLAGWSKTPANAPGKWSGTFNIPGFPDVKTMEDFRTNEGAQAKVYELHKQRTEQEIDRLGLGRYEGQTVGGVEITRDGLRAMIHLAGAEGTARTLQSGGQINPADANGTTALDYARLGASNAQPGDLTGSRSGLLALGMLKKDMTQDLSKKITDFQAAINKTEFPPMKEIGALIGQVGYLGNEEQKRQVTEMAAQAEYGKAFTQLPQAQRDEVVAGWKEKLKTGATQYERHLADTVITADKRVTEEWKRDPYEAAVQFSEGFKALPAIDWASPTASGVLAAKVAQQNTFRADQNLPAVSVLRPGEAQQLAQVLVSGDPKQGSAAIRMMSDTLPVDMYRATISSAPIKAALDGMVRSYDPDRLNTAMSVLDRSYRDDPLGFKAALGDSTLNRLQDWQARKDYLPPDQMAEYFKRADDPAFATARKHLLADAETKVTGLTPAKVANELGSVADRWVPFVNQSAPVDPLAGAALVAEYDQTFKDRYVGTGDVDKAKAQTVERLKTVWGPSTVAGGALMRHPPERYYPQVDGSYDWMKRDITDAINASRMGSGRTVVSIPGVPEPPLGAPEGGEIPAYTYKLLSDARTDADVAAKRAPSYVVVTRDIASGRDQIPLSWDGKPQRFSFDPANAQEAARVKFQTNRESAALTAAATSPGAIGNSP